MSVAVLIPCFNESSTIEAVIEDYRGILPDAAIWVFDNNSTDDSAKRAKLAGARVVSVHLQGKGNVVRRMFADVDADCYLLVDGDRTYDAGSAPKMIEAIVDGGADMVVARREAVSAAAYRSGHAWGNRVLTGFLNRLFGASCSDVLSGYRAFSRRFVKSFPVLSEGFEIETELTVHALELRVPIDEVPSVYRPRPEGSHSKLNTWRDGWRIATTMLKLFATEKPLWFYGLVSALFGLAGLVLGLPLVSEWYETGLVPRFPTAILATGLVLLAALSFLTGLILRTVSRGRREAKFLAYLAQGPSASE